MPRACIWGYTICTYMHIVVESDLYTELSQRFQLLSHAARLQILDELRYGEACVCHLQAVLGRPQAYISQQLRVLREAGWIEGRQDGLNVYYRLVDVEVEKMLEQALGPVEDRGYIPKCPCPKCASKQRSGKAPRKSGPGQPSQGL